MAARGRRSPEKNAPRGGFGADDGWMRRALALARRAEGRTRPNPPVGAVVVRDGVAVGEGYHRRAGTAHAEVVALDRAGRQARGATLYVTLEPCCTHGRTPPCTDRILAAGVARVVVGIRDPNPRHAGRGLRLLRRAGVAVETDICRTDAESLLAPFGCWVTQGRPFVTLKMGMTLDGRIADTVGRSRWITSSPARRCVMALRKRVDAVMVGIGTALADDPSLLWSKTGTCQPMRIVVDARGRLPLTARVLCDGWVRQTVVATTRACPDERVAAYEACGATVWRLAAARGHVSLPALMRRAGREGLLHVLCEGGGVLAGGLLDAGLVDDALFFVAPKVLGAGCAVVTGRPRPLRSVLPLEFTGLERLGCDVLMHARPTGGKAKRCSRG